MTSDLIITVRADADHVMAVCDLDGHEVYRGTPGDHPVCVRLSLDESDGQHELALTMAGKTLQDTQLVDGEIKKDVMLHIDSVCVDDVDITQLFYQQAMYQHNYNGTGKWVSERVYQRMGCNGTVRFGFRTPVYTWLLEQV